MDLPKRKPTRLKNYDYSTDGYYFITICTHNKRKILCDIVGEGLCALPYIKLTAICETVKKSIEYVNLKSFTTREYGKTLWQRSFHDHIIRGEKDYLEIWNYIDTNPQKWETDCFYNV